MGSAGPTRLTPPSLPSADWSVGESLRRWNLSCVNVRLDSFGADKPDLARSALPGRHHIQMIVVTLGRDEADSEPDLGKKPPTGPEEPTNSFH